MADESETNFTHLRVTVPFKCKGKYANIEYSWKGGESLTMPIEAARHLFGFGLDDKAPAFHRIGLLSANTTLEWATELLGQCTFQPLKQVYEIAPSAPRRGRPPKISNDRSLVNAGGTKGPVSENPAPVPDDHDDDEDDDVSAEAI